MKPEKEVFWIVNLLKSKFVRKLLGEFIVGCRYEFERVAGASENNKSFKEWMDILIEEGCFEPFGKRKFVGGTIDTYVIDKNKLIKRLRKIEFYKDIRNLIRTEETAFGF